MERDFLGLSDKQYLCHVKREVNDDVVGEQGLSMKAAREWEKANVFATSNFMPAADFQETKPFPGAYHWGSASVASVFRRGQFSGAFQNATPLLLGGSVPLTHSTLVPRVASSGSLPQLTIFYEGTVRVFNDISPNKAQAIMLCAGESSLKKQQTVREVERVYGKQIHNVAAAAASSSSATHADSFKPVATTNPMSMIQSFNVASGSMIPSVPQARKASLARFLEKRKERLMSAMPYKKMLLDLSTGESSGMNYSSTSPT
ncbi:Protein TIFY 7 [Cardamine amara subsp. amara]|uniref:Protein TIFY n=1 Tax=Cardamine amara subsp. amara TaxID=228776 RepID=A0ABD1BEN4_CARAN